MLKRVKSFLLENKTTKQKIVKNTFWLFLGQIGSRLIKSTIIIYAARILGASEWGAFSYALSLAAFFTIFTDFGISSVVTRESSKDLSLQEKYFTTSIILKLLMTAFVIAITFIIAPFVIKQESVLILIPIVVTLTALDGMRDFGASLSRAWEKMEIDAFIQIFTNVAIIIGGFIALAYVPSAKSLSIGYTIGVGIGMLIAFYPFRHYLKNIRQKFDGTLIKPILYASWPIGISGLMGAAMLNTDTLMIGWLSSIDQVGYYSAGQKIVQLAYLIPSLLSAALFPVLAKFSADRLRFRTIVEKSLTFVMLLAAPLTIATVLVSANIIRLLYGDAFDPSIASFRIMNLTYVALFLSSILINSLFALNKEKVLFKYSVIGFVGNLIFNFLFIPRWGINGSAASTLITQLLTAGYLFYCLKKTIEFSFISSAKKIILSSGIMGGLAILLSYLHIHPYLTAIIATGAYAGSLVASKETVFTEIKEMLLKKRVA